VNQAFVVDASTVIAWAHPAQSTPESNAWLDRVADGAELVVPSIWGLEIANALLVLQRRRVIVAADRDAALRLVRALPTVLDHDGSSRALTDLSEIAARESLSVYDASYLELALRRNLPLACRDGALQKAARRLGVRITP